VGVQSFDDELLKASERYHKYGSGEEIVSRLRATQGKLDTLNVDMIFNFPMQTRQTLETGPVDPHGACRRPDHLLPVMPSSYAAEAMRKRLGGAVDFARERDSTTHRGHTATQYKPSTALVLLAQRNTHR